MHPLTILAVGLHGEVLPNQNGALLRLVVPWIRLQRHQVHRPIRFVEKQPQTSWMINWPEAYGFYSNVNPTVNHPRHSQATEARLPGRSSVHENADVQRYEDQVASLYKEWICARITDAQNSPGHRHRVAFAVGPPEGGHRHVARSGATLTA